MFTKLLRNHFPSLWRSVDPPELSLSDYVEKVFPAAHRTRALRFYSALDGKAMIARDSKSDVQGDATDWWSRPFDLVFEWPPEERADYWCIARNGNFEEIGVTKVDGKIIEISWAGGALIDARRSVLSLMLFGPSQDEELRTMVAESFPLFIERLKMRVVPTQSLPTVWLDL